MLLHFLNKIICVDRFSIILISEDILSTDFIRKNEFLLMGDPKAIRRNFFKTPISRCSKMKLFLPSRMRNTISTLFFSPILIKHHGLLPFSKALSTILIGGLCILTIQPLFWSKTPKKTKPLLIAFHKLIKDLK